MTLAVSLPLISIARPMHAGPPALARLRVDLAGFAVLKGVGSAEEKESAEGVAKMGGACVDESLERFSWSDAQSFCVATGCWETGEDGTSAKVVRHCAAVADRLSQFPRKRSSLAGLAAEVGRS
jgi:hypothetical protein